MVPLLGASVQQLTLLRGVMWGNEIRKPQFVKSEIQPALQVAGSLKVTKRGFADCQAGQTGRLRRTGIPQSNFDLGSNASPDDALQLLNEMTFVNKGDDMWRSQGMGNPNTGICHEITWHAMSSSEPSRTRSSIKYLDRYQMVKLINN